MMQVLIFFTGDFWRLDGLEVSTKGRSHVDYALPIANRNF